jgi:hypothetical protein
MTTATWLPMGFFDGREEDGRGSRSHVLIVARLGLFCASYLVLDVAE